MGGDAKIIAAFDAAAESYDAWTSLQREVARALVARAGGAPDSILDLGAGTGHVTGFAREKWPDARISALDGAPKMLERLRQKFAVQTICADAARFDTLERHDLILSGMMLHWLPEPARVLEHWRGFLAPGGELHVALPVAGCLPEWRELLARAGLADSLWPFPAADQFAPCDSIDLPAHFDSARAFAQSLKKSGAHIGAPDTKPHSPAALRKAISHAKKPFGVTFRVAFLRIRARSAKNPACRP
jgi:malonyl-CoA O-methyltransferase